RTLHTLPTRRSSDLKTATTIVDNLGEQAVTKILEDPELLSNVPNLQQKTARNLASTLKEHQGFEQIAVKLTKYRIGLKMAQQLYTLYKEETMRSEEHTSELQ